MIAPSSPPRMTVGSTTLRSIIPLPIVFAIAVPNTNAATKFQNAAQKTAAKGVSTRVETTVAIELAASWKPLIDRKSTRLNSSHGYISYAVFCLKKKNKNKTHHY